MNIKDYKYSGKRVDLSYRVFSPENYRGLPLLIFLHGAGERGVDTLDVLYRHGIPRLICDGAEISAVVLCPQCPSDMVWDNVVLEVKDIIDKTAEEYGILSDRIVLTGSSMGGFGTWALGLAYPDFFAAIAPVCGGGMAWRAGLIARAKTPVLAYHGTEDVSVVPEYSKIMINRVKSEGGEARLVMLDGMGHNDGANYAYRETELVDWLLSQRR